MKMSKPPLLSLKLLTALCISTILSIRNWPISAEYGLSSVIMLLLAALLFFIPVSLVCAELSSRFSENSGMYYWIKEAFGHKWGFASVWYAWISNVVWYPIILSFASTCLLYSLGIQVENHPYLLFITMQLSFWLLITLNLQGIKFSSTISSTFLWLGTLLPGAILIILSCIYALSGNPLQIDFSFQQLIPPFSSLKEWVFFAGLALGFSGMEMPAVFATEVKNPAKNYPKAIFYSAFTILVFSILGTFSIAMVIPKENINFVTAIVDAMFSMLDFFHLSAFMPFMSFMIAIGAFGGICTWITGPSKGLIIALEKVKIPSVIYQKNAKNVPNCILLIQGTLVSCLSAVFLFMPSASSSFWILTVLASQLYVITYLLIFFSAVRLRLQQPEIMGIYRVSKKIYGFMLIAFAGITTSIFTFFIGFVPPKLIGLENTLFHGGFLLCAMAVFPFPVFLLKEKRQKSLFSKGIKNNF